MTELDHIAVIAPDLAAGVAWVREALGVDMPAGGKHPEMGTHNHLLSLGHIYLEVIAVDPQAPKPPHRRWFGLDDRDAVERHWSEGRRLRGYVARCTDVAATVGAQADTFGAPMRISRGGRRWVFAVRPDGALPADGALPSLIDWGERGTPAPTMPDFGLRLQLLHIETPDLEAAHLAIEAIGMVGRPQIQRGPRVRLTATVATPNGVRVLN
jgi:Glyoxalase-like domain